MPRLFLLFQAGRHRYDVTVNFQIVVLAVFLGFFYSHNDTPRLELTISEFCRVTGREEQWLVMFALFALVPKPMHFRLNCRLRVPEGRHGGSHK